MVVVERRRQLSIGRRAGRPASKSDRQAPAPADGARRPSICLYCVGGDVTPCSIQSIDLPDFAVPYVRIVRIRPRCDLGFDRMRNSVIRSADPEFARKP